VAPAPGPVRLPTSVFVLGAAVFVLGTSEFMLSGLLPEVSDDLGVSIPTAGLLISAFAIGMVVGAPGLAAATQRLPRRETLVGLLAVFGLSHLAGALAPGYGVLFATRVVSALACAGFWAVGTAVAMSLVPAHARARAMAVMIGGLSIANVAGVPGGAVLGQHLGWRSAFWAVALLTALGLAGVLAFVPRGAGHRPAAERPALRTELRIYRDAQVWLAIVTTGLYAGGLACFFSYLAPLITDVAGLGESWVPVTLVLFGTGALAGTILGGRFADRHMFRTLYIGFASAAVLLAVIAATAGTPAALVPLAGVLGAGAYVAAPGLNARIFNLAGHTAPTLAAATVTSAFNSGNAIGPWVGGLAIGAGLGYRSTAWIGAAMLLLGLGGAWLQSRYARHPARVVATGPRHPDPAPVRDHV
jgi:DHA1 family chloramphenicol resistance protein-like MFS transporter